MKPRHSGRSARKPGHVSLERALSKLGIASRTQARAWILEGKVRVNGKLCENPSFSVFPEKAKIEIEGSRVERAERITLLLHKPRGTITSRSDEKGRPTVFSLIEDKSLKLHAVGRLDWATSGLLLLTNDTKLSSWLTDPANGVPRVYVVTVRGEITDEKLERLRQGVRVATENGGELLAPDAIELRKASQRESHLTVTLSEGKNREIRRLFLAVGNEVTRLKRIAYGHLELGDLAPGEYRVVTEEELKNKSGSFFGK